MGASSQERSGQSLKILMTADAVGGVWQYAVDLIRGLSLDGASVLVATMGPRPSDDQKHQLLSIPDVTLAQSDYALEWMPDPWCDVEAGGQWLLDLAKSFEPDLIHLNGYAHGTLAWNQPVVITAHSCVYSWWRAVHGCAPGEEWSEYKRRVFEGLTASDVIVAPSAYMARAIEQEYGIETQRLKVIHNFNHAALRSEPADKQNYILAAGRIWDAAKNLSLLDEIASEVNWPIRLAGSERGPENSLAHPESLIPLGRLTHAGLLEQMEHAAIFAHPAFYEPFGLSVLEAAQRQCCLVLSDIPSLRELWEGAAVFVDPHRPREWIEALNSLIADPSRRQFMARLASAHVARYRAADSIAAYRELYSSLLNSKREKRNEAA